MENITESSGEKGNTENRQARVANETLEFLDLPDVQDYVEESTADDSLLYGPMSDISEQNRPNLGVLS